MDMGWQCLEVSKIKLKALTMDEMKFTVDTGPVVVEPGHWCAGDPDVQDDDLARVHRHRG